jgi:hypothetical protein
VAAGNLVSFSVGPSGGDNLQGCSVEIAPLPSSDSAIHESGAGKP